VRVLVAEDDQAIGETLSDVLETEGHRVRWAHDGLEALHMLDRDRPDVILLDLMMPRMDGFAFRARQKRDPRFADIPVLVISAHARAGEVDAAAFLPKPFSIDDLLDALARCTGRAGTGSTAVERRPH
jgi:CheY-like chemotaxis protein